MIDDYWTVKDSISLYDGGKNVKRLQNKAYDYILNGNKNFKFIVDRIEGKRIKFIRISAKEYVYGRNSKMLNREQYKKKMKIAPYIDEFINRANITYCSPLIHESKLFKNGFNNYQGKVAIDNCIFAYIVRIGRTKKDSIFYDISLEFLGYKKGTEYQST